MGHYYKTMYNIDFRCLRYNSLISPDDNQFNGCTDYASEIFIKADKNQQYPIALSKHRKISFSYIDDIVNATINIVDTPKENLTQTTYNLNCVTLVNPLPRVCPKFMVLLRVGVTFEDTYHSFISFGLYVKTNISGDPVGTVGLCQ